MAIGLPAGGGPLGGGRESRDELRRIAEAEHARFHEAATLERNEAAERAARLAHEFQIWGSPGLSDAARQAGQV